MPTKRKKTEKKKRKLKKLKETKRITKEILCSMPLNMKVVKSKSLSQRKKARSQKVKQAIGSNSLYIALGELCTIRWS